MNETVFLRPPGNCPPGHFIAINAGGKGHWIGDSCGCEPPTSNIDGIGFWLFLTAIALIIIFHKKIEKVKKLKIVTRAVTKEYFKQHFKMKAV